MSADGTEILFNSDAARRRRSSTSAWREYSPPDFLNSNSYDGRVAFATGQVAMYVAGAWFASVMQDEFPDITELWNAAPLPQKQRCATTSRRRRPGHPRGWQEPRRGLEVDRVPLRPAKPGSSGRPGRRRTPAPVLPPRTSLLEDPTVFELNPLLEGFAQQMECGVTDCAPNPRFGEVEVALNDALGRAIYGEIDAATALDEAAEEAEDILSEADSWPGG